MSALQRFKDVMAQFQEVSDTAPDAHAAVLRHLAWNDYECFAEEPVWYGEGRQGRIDIFATCRRTGTNFAVEIDARKPRIKSLQKLNALHKRFGVYRVVMLRGVSEGDEPIEGVDLLIGLPVRMEGSTPRASVRDAARAVAQ